MRIAFDLDDTIIPGRIPFDLEPMPKSWVRRPFCSERIRAGTTLLFNELRRAGHQLVIYTTSFRSPRSVKLMFRAYGTRVSKVINEETHRKKMRKLGERFKLCTKLPPAFQIDLLIDNCGAVLQESLEFNFAMLQVHPTEMDWANRVRNSVGLG